MAAATLATSTVLACWPVPDARAAETDADEPERLIRIGNELRRKGDHVRAFGYLQRAYDLSRTPRAAAQLGLCEEALGRFWEAENHLTEALGSHDAWVDAKRGALEEARSSGRKHLGNLKVTSAPAGTTVSVGDRPPQRLGSDGRVWTAPGPVNLTFAAEGYRRSSKAVTLTPGEEVTIEAGLVPLSFAGTATAPPALVPSARPLAGAASPGAVAGGAVSTAHPAGALPERPEAPPPTPNEKGEDDRGAWRITGLAIGGAGAAMVVGGVVLELAASHKFNAINDDAAANRPYDSANGNWKTFEGGAIALFAAGGAAMVAGTTLYLLNREPAGTSEPAGVAARVRQERSAARHPLWPTFSFDGGAGRGAVAGLSGRF